MSQLLKPPTNRVLPRGAWLAALLTLALAALLPAADPPPKPQTEDDFYRLINFPLPADVVLEVGGIDWQDKERTKLLVCTRRGELFRLTNVYAAEPGFADQQKTVKGPDGKPTKIDVESANLVKVERMLFGLHEPLGLLTLPSGIYMAQRTELTRAQDNDDDGRIDEVTTFANGWETSGGYHEFAFGPKIDPQGKMWVTLNRPFGNGQEPEALWRGWAVTIDSKGNVTPVCCGLRSPCGLGTNPAGDMFYTDNQGDWVPACKLSHLKPGSFHGNDYGLKSCGNPLAGFHPPAEKGWPKSGLLYPQAVAEMPEVMPAAVWFPYSEMGTSHSDVVYDSTGGKFGPFANQMFVGDQGHAIVVRVFLEKVDGEYQGACFPFRKGFASGVLRMCFGSDGSMFAGGTNRGWGGGPRPYSLDRLVWTGLTPFEIHEMRAKSDGFELTFTQPVDSLSATNVKSYAAKSWTYHYHETYGDKPSDEKSLTIKEAKVAPDGKSVRLVLDELRPYYVHEIRVPGLRSAEGQPVLHPIGYYTLNHIPK